MIIGILFCLTTVNNSSFVTLRAHTLSSKSLFGYAISFSIVRFRSHKAPYGADSWVSIILGFNSWVFITFGFDSWVSIPLGFDYCVSITLGFDSCVSITLGLIIGFPSP